MSRFNVRKVAVLGAGVMGAQIAAHLVNVKVPVVLFDLPAKEGPKNGIVTKAVEGLKKLKPAPLGVPEDAALIEQANYEEHSELLRGCDLIIEAIAERMDWKLDLYTKIAPFLSPDAIIASNTSGLSITKLSEVLPEAIKPRFCGIHFFNPPRYMSLVELIATPTTQPEIIDQLETLVTTALGKSVVRAKDTPNFIANRVGIAGILATFKEAENYGLSYDVVDDLTGKKLGRASSGTFRTADVVGLDTMSHVIKTLQDNLKDDPFYESYATPAALASLISKGALGQKTGAGFYKKVGKDIQRFDPATGEYVAGGKKADDIVARILKKAPAERLKLLRESSNPQAQFVWAILRNSFHYAAVHLADIADTARDVDFATRWGFGASNGPFELWQQAGWKQVAEWVKADIDAGKALSRAPLPAWVFDGRDGVHTAEGSWSPTKNAYVPRSKLPVYERQHFPEDVAGAGATEALKAGTEVFRNDEVRVWTLDGDVLIASITAKLHLISPTVTEGLVKAVELAESKYKGLVIWSPDDVFSAGANLEALMPVFMKSGAKGIAPEEKKLQDAMLRIRYAQVPVVSAVRGIALGGGCELAVHSARRVAAMESYMGLVEVGVGLIPGGGGLTYIARRAAELAATNGANADLFTFLRETFTSAATAKVGTSAIENRKLGYLVEGDVVVPNKDELLYVAVQQAKSMFESGYRAPLRAKFPVAGRSVIATIKASLANMRDGGFISAHDFHIGALIADVVCGGEVEAGSLVDEEYLMGLERKHFCGLLEHPKTQERIMGMLSTGKPVRN
ncbi:3-hydroxyacyl-CoA dehydrogenase/enoyl-CoA hydratase family protein [Rhizobacter sp. LjRoot28]|uniref:3-hydroxyacyl-CoA dehydrogenase/enoyl-CoA hydratase family protein n=1 Tax=Rhizobacter sp. LjRoot28 TaxID=3342309 RepID=UPI003ED10A33